MSVKTRVSLKMGFRESHAAVAVAFVSLLFCVVSLMHNKDVFNITCLGFYLHHLRGHNSELYFVKVMLHACVLTNLRHILNNQKPLQNVAFL